MLPFLIFIIYLVSPHWGDLLSCRNKKVSKEMLPPLLVLSVSFGVFCPVRF